MMTLNLHDFDISEETGFIPAVPPLRKLPETFLQWEALAQNLTSLISQGRIRQEVHQLPTTEFSEQTLRSEAEWRRAFVVLTFLSQAYIWTEGEKGLPDKVPAVLAVPWNRVAQRLGLPPVICYSATVLNNWGLHNPFAPVDSKNVFALMNFTGSTDESCFYTTHVLVELAAVPALKAVVQAYVAVTTQQDQILIQNLKTVQTSLQSMLQALAVMYEGCNPTFYYVKVRPFQAGSKGLDVLPDGILYEGVDPRPRKYFGGSAAQSTSVQVIDIFMSGKLGISSSEDFLLEVREHMPPKHRKFLTVLEQQPAVREYVKQSGNKELIISYNGAVEALAAFRTEHIKMASRYILVQKHHSINASLDDKGTGGTDFVHFLKRIRDETLALQLDC